MFFEGKKNFKNMSIYFTVIINESRSTQEIRTNLNMQKIPAKDKIFQPLFHSSNWWKIQNPDFTTPPAS